MTLSQIATAIRASIVGALLYRHTPFGLIN